jgi:glycosyltransferase involved in cell wall biosynthesis
MPRLSVVIITRNEEVDVSRTLQAVSFADEVLVVDSGSTDRTVAQCRSMGARVLQHEFHGFGQQKRWAVEQAVHDWVLCVDADEVVTPQLADAIRVLLDRGEPPCSAYRFRFLTVFMDRLLEHGPVSRRRHVRLFDRRRAGWSSVPVHEQVESDGEVGELPGAILHYTVHDLSESIGKMDAYSTLAAAELVRRSKRRSTVALVLTFPVQFVRHYLLNQNFRNGIPGLAWSLLNALGSAMKYLKARELEAASRRPVVRHALAGHDNAPVPGPGVLAPMASSDDGPALAPSRGAGS